VRMWEMLSVCISPTRLARGFLVGRTRKKAEWRQDYRFFKKSALLQGILSDERTQLSPGWHRKI